MRFKKMRDVIAPALLLLALLFPPAAKGQTDNFFYIDESDYRGDASGAGSWLGFGDNAGGEASWVGFDEGDPLPTGGGLLLLTLSGACYAVAKRRKSGKLKD